MLIDGGSGTSFDCDSSDVLSGFSTEFDCSHVLICGCSVSILISLILRQSLLYLLESETEIPFIIDF